MKPKPTFILSVVFLLPFILFSLQAPAQKDASRSGDSIVFSFKAGPQFWTVPSGAGSLHAEVYGAQGGSAHGGKGGHVAADLNVSPGAKLILYIGGQPAGAEEGANGGGKGCGKGTGGGGASDIRIDGNELSKRVLVAGGGGGAGYGGTGGAGGGLTGGEGAYFDGSAAHMAKGGTQEAGGKGARAYFAKDGVAGTGGEGININGQCTNGAMGGGGGGYYGGGGSGAGGGGGGSSYADAQLTRNVMHHQGVNEGNGRIVLYWSK